MQNEQLRKIAVYTGNSRIIGHTTCNFLETFTKGMSYRDIHHRDLGRLLFVGPPHGDPIDVRQAHVRDSQALFLEEKTYRSYSIAKTNIFFIHDFLTDPSPDKTAISYEKTNAEKRARLETIEIDVPHFNITIKGKTYLYRNGYEKGLIMPHLQYAGWIMLQQPVFYGKNATFFYQTFEMATLQKDHRFQLNVLMINLEKMNIAIP